jgi:hypothetical protein
MVAEQREQDQDDDYDPETAQAIVAIIAAVIAVIAAASAEQEDQDDNDEKQGHGGVPKVRRKSARQGAPLLRRQIGRAYKFRDRRRVPFTGERIILWRV